ncbi:MAG: hypothetical protein KDE48_11845 [Anaerolineales bacterium]|nr:hypothetical protein [Anaerolineales bacterium]
MKHYHPQLNHKSILSKAIILYLIIVALALIANIAPVQSAAAQSTSITLTPSTFQIQGCEIVDVAIRINNIPGPPGPGLYGADVLLTFDPAVLEVIDTLNAQEGIVDNILVPPLFVTRDYFDNMTGEVRYAATQLHPTPDAYGSGNLLIVRFRAKSENLSAPFFSYTKLGNRNGVEIPASTAGAAVSTMAPAAASAFEISILNSTTPRLDWTAVVDHDQFNLYRETTPYFSPGSPYQVLPTTQTQFDDVGALGNPVPNYYYLLGSTCNNGFEGIAADRVGEFDFEIVPGS